MAVNKVYFYVFVSCWLFLQLPGMSSKAVAQEIPLINLEAVEIVEQRLSPFAIGTKSISLDSTSFALEALPNLADVINYYTSIAVKSYGNGMLSTISFRGTGPSHTAVLWHGINISYPMLGQSDLSILSLALSEQVTIQAGTGSALYGSGALGGTISLSNNQPAIGTNISLSQWFGSFGTIKNNMRGSYTNEKFFIKILTMWDQSNNNFIFKNTTKVGSPIEVQEGADYKMLGTAIEAGVVLGTRGKLNISGQYLNADRNLQPSMNANTSGDNQTDENIRLRAKYLYNGDKLNWNVNYAYLHDIIGFNEAKTFANQQILRAEVERHLFSWLNFNLASDYNFIQINSPFYAAEITSEQRANIWASFLLNPVRRLVLSINLRQSFSPQYKIPFTPSFGAEYNLVDGPTHHLRLKTLMARGFRIPTLNELYWQPGGNPNLEPENSYSFEFGIAGKSMRGLTFNYELTGYRMWVDNWILWRPQGSYWSPENVKYVDVYGIEVSGSLAHRLATANISWRGNYAFTKSINRTGLDQFDRSLDKQLAYVPVHKATISSITELKSWSLLINAAYTGQRYVTADNEESLSDHFLINLRLGKNFSSGKYSFGGHANINNVLNTSYQSIKNKAMPGINFLLGLTITYNKS